MSYGRCPVYRLTLSATGRATYQGLRRADRSTPRHSRPRDRQRSRSDHPATRVRRPGTGVSPPSTDLPSQELVLWSGRRPSRVVDHGSAPAEFWAMAALVDAVAAQIEWVTPTTIAPRGRRADAPSLPLLRQPLQQPSGHRSPAARRKEAARHVDVVADGGGPWLAGDGRWIRPLAPGASMLEDGPDFDEIDIAEVERLQPLMDSPTLWAVPRDYGVLRRHFFVAIGVVPRASGRYYRVCRLAAQ